MIITGESDFYNLLDIWFPDKKPLPTAFLVDTSEEALLLPDWLKLRMIRSEVARLVDAGTTTHSIEKCVLLTNILLLNRTTHLFSRSFARPGATAAVTVRTVLWHSRLQHE